MEARESAEAARTNMVCAASLFRGFVVTARQHFTILQLGALYGFAR